jgi:hypothetical protein
MKLPCRNCISLAICRHKPFVIVLNCTLVTDYHRYYLDGLRAGSNGCTMEYKRHRKIIMKVMKPTRWSVTSDGLFTVGSE